MMAIARAENRGCNPLNHNLTNTENHRVCIGSYGVLQVGCVHFRPDENRNDTTTVGKVKDIQLGLTTETVRIRSFYDE